MSSSSFNENKTQFTIDINIDPIAAIAALSAYSDALKIRDNPENEKLILEIDEWILNYIKNNNICGWDMAKEGKSDYSPNVTPDKLNLKD